MNMEPTPATMVNQWKARAAAAEARADMLEAFARRLIDDDDLTPDTLDYWADEYLHAYRQLGDVERLHAHIAELERQDADNIKTFSDRLGCNSAWVAVGYAVESMCQRVAEIERQAAADAIATHSEIVDPEECVCKGEIEKAQFERNAINAVITWAAKEQARAALCEVKAAIAAVKKE